MVRNKPKNVIKERKKNAAKVSKQKVQKSNDIVLSNKFAPLVNYQPVENPQSMADCKAKCTKSQYKKNKNDEKPKKNHKNKKQKKQKKVLKMKKKKSQKNHKNRKNKK